MGVGIKSLAMRVLQRHGAVSTQSQPVTEGETPVRLPEAARAPAVGLGDLQTGSGLPTRRCWMCNGGVYWVSVYGAVVCVRCHAPANRALVKTWHWLPECEGKKVQ
jgi:hypothetical protein